LKLRNRKKIISALLLVLCLAGFGQVKVQNLSTESMTDPLGLDLARPRISWQLTSDQRNTLQTAYRNNVIGQAGFGNPMREALWTWRIPDRQQPFPGPY